MVSSNVKVIANSISSISGAKITTLQVRFQRFILPEFNTHRVFSRNFSSSRAIPTKVLLEQVINDPAMPVYWGKNQPGMQASSEVLDSVTMEAMWRAAAKDAVSHAKIAADMGLHKQTVNRLIEPFLWVNGIVTSTEWDNWFSLREHPDAQPEIHSLALAMREAMQNSIPEELGIGEWHLPYVLPEEKKGSISLDNLKKISAARCCRVSYLKHDGTSPCIEDDLKLFDRLAGSVPLHASPLEHQATPMYYGDTAGNMCGNLRGWYQFRKFWEKEVQ